MNNTQTGNCAHCTRTGVDVMQLTFRGRPICLQCIQLQDEAHDDYDDRDATDYDEESTYDPHDGENDWGL